ncbi:histidine kinase [Marivibrio halodurans]|uniref:histidine kinase n=1 Tax=Marivibrio halodurans TaxID=2039722 RepID=A0A8J7V254_9PROT|nr:sensor histidine kinase [Marivibrio halodurans]MBP5858481.1 histidine kinase [Marivibrio halodurans]
MLTTGSIILIAAFYLGGLFLLAFISERRAARGRARFINSPLVYTLSLAVYCTSWTFYGAVGSASRNGLEFLTIYLGPTLVLMAWWFLMRKLVRISKAQRITSIADFISARYGKSASISALVTIIAVSSVAPYIALQLKAVAASVDALGGLQMQHTVDLTPRGVLQDTGFWVAVCMALFTILFGTRNQSADERQPGIVAAIAFESIVKLISLGAIALFALYGLGDGIVDIFSRADWHAGVDRLTTFQAGFETRWLITLFLSAAAFICLPRQFHVGVVENNDERHVATASWMFPLYLMLVSLFVIPIAISGMTQLPETANPDLYVLTVPLSAGKTGLALIAFIGGLSAATSMVIVSSIAMSIMISNHLVTPLLLRFGHFMHQHASDFSPVLILVRRLSIVAILALGFLYYHSIGTASPLASIGLISFAGVAQFLPALIGGIYWEGATRQGATTGLLVGFAFWLYTLLLPNFASAGWGFKDIVEHGPMGIELLRPGALFGFHGWDPLVHGLTWSLTLNIVCYIGVSLFSIQSPLERLQSAIFVHVFDRGRRGVEGAIPRSATTEDLIQLARRILGRERADRLFSDYAAARGMGAREQFRKTEPGLIHYVERALAGSIGAASARSLVSRIAKGETISLESVIQILDETQEAIRYSRELERKSRELEETARQLREANAQLTELDRLKDDFLSRVSHELRTPMTSIRSFSEMLVERDGDGAPTIDEEQAQHFLSIIQHESVRLTRLLDQILDLNRMENGQLDWDLEACDLADIARAAIETMRGLATNNGVEVIDRLGEAHLPVVAEPDHLKQVFVNLLSNAIKFNDAPQRGGTGRVWIEVDRRSTTETVCAILVRDNGPGIPPAEQQTLFSKFSRGWKEGARRPTGSGLGLAISKQIILQFGGELTLTASSPAGSSFSVRLPRDEGRNRTLDEDAAPLPGRSDAAE